MYFNFIDNHNLEFFMNDKYTVLKAMSDNQVNVNGFPYCNLSQQEIADMVHMSKMKVNGIIQELIERNYLQLFEGKKGKYEVTEKGAKALWIVQSGEVK